jgi:nicotinate-nucleotide adenylyltransferase
LAGKRQKIGLYGGTFDPIHLGHLRLAMDILEMRGLDQVWFVLAATSPFKSGVISSAAHHRLEMVKRAIRPIPEFQVVDIELHRPGLSYTIDTVEALMAQQPNDYSLILGDDSMADFPRWHRVEELVNLIPILVGRRGGHQPFPEQASPKVLVALHQGFTETHVMEVSGTEIRARLKENLYTGHLISAPVLEYIIDKGLYTGE